MSFSFKVTNLQTLDQQLRDLVILQMQNAEKIVSGKSTKDQYMSAEKNYENKKKELVDKIETLQQQLSS